jgi:hypothetical protein
MRPQIAHRRSSRNPTLARGDCSTAGWFIYTVRSDWMLAERMKYNLLF